MVLQNIDEKFASLRHYLDWSENDDQRIPQLRTILLPYARVFVEDFYAEIVRNPAIAKVITGGERQIARLQNSLLRWIEELLSGKYDAEYVKRRWKVGYRHVEIGLDQTYVNIAHSRLRMQMQAVLLEELKKSAQQLRDCEITLHKLLDLDLTLISAAYEVELQVRQRPINAARLQQQKWLTQLSEAALRGPDLETLFDLVNLALLQSLKVDVAAILQPTGSFNRWKVVSQQGLPSGLVEIESQPHDALARNAASDLPQIVEDIRLHQSFVLPTILSGEGWISALVAGIQYEDKPIAVFLAASRNKVAWKESDFDFIKSLRNLLSSAIHRLMQMNRWKESEQRLRRLIDRLPAGAMYIVDQELFINSAIETMSGYSRTEMRTLEFWNQIVRDAPKAEITMASRKEGTRKGAVVQYRQLLRRKDGTDRIIEVTALRAATDEIWLVTDITESEQQRHQALQAERLAAIGQMITGLAHEARNALQRMRASTESLELELEDHGEVQQDLTRLSVAQDDLTRLFNEVQNYAAPLVLERELVDIRLIADQAWESLGRQRLGRQAHFLVDIADELSHGHYDAFRLQQVFRNFFENSLAACRDPMEISIHARLVKLEGQVMVEYSVRDNGPGLSESARQHVFDPFFTTKTKGTGLGMAIASRIVEAHGGQLQLGPAQPSGADFRLLLPRVEYGSSASDRHRG